MKLGSFDVFLHETKESDKKVLLCLAKRDINR